MATGTRQFLKLSQSSENSPQRLFVNKIRHSLGREQTNIPRAAESGSLAVLQAPITTAQLRDSGGKTASFLRLRFHPQDALFGGLRAMFQKF